MKNLHSLYLHIPFCHYICTYCAFNTYKQSDLIPAYVDALAREIEFVGKQQRGLPIKTLFLGGGTPSNLTINQLEKIVGTIEDYFDLANATEICLETNPEDLSADYVRGLKSLGFNRVSIGMQSAVSRELTLFGREHDLNQVRRAVEVTRNAGFDNISLDIIFGTPGQRLDDWMVTLNEVISLDPAHISLYGLELHGGTPLTEKIKSGVLSEIDDENFTEMYFVANEKLGLSGLEQYEISNWAKTGFESQHNKRYWYNSPYLGLGAGAHGYANNMRTIVRRAPSRYISAMETEISPESLAFPETPASSKITPVDQDSEISETIMMGLRLTKEGINREHFRLRFGVDVYDIRQRAIEKHIQRGYLELTPDYLRLTPAAYLISNSVLVDLI